MSRLREINNLSAGNLVYATNHLYVGTSPEEDPYGLVLTDVKPDHNIINSPAGDSALNASTGRSIVQQLERSSKHLLTAKQKSETATRHLNPQSPPRQSGGYLTSEQRANPVPRLSVLSVPSPSPRRKVYETNLNLIDFSSPPTSPSKHSSEEPTKRPGKFFVSGSSVEDDSLVSLAEELASLKSDISLDFDVESLVEISLDESSPLYGVVRWIGRPAGKILVGVELEEEIEEAGDGYYCGKRYFDCPPKHALFVPPEKCKVDSRFEYNSKKILAVDQLDHRQNMDFGSPDCPPIGGAIAPVSHPKDISDFFGKFRGIQGHHNSCYLDATIFSMFTFTSVFDCLLYRPPNRSDIAQYSEVQRLLREEIVNPLRRNFYVRADRVMKLRRLLQSLSSVTGLTNEEKDPEEFLHCLLAQTLRAEPLLKLHTGQEAFHHQLFVEKDEQLLCPNVQQLFEQSFLSSSIKLKEIPPCLILQMPRFGKSYKMYPYVLPSLLLDVTDILENSPRQCIVCGRLAELECPECLGQCGNGLESIAFCSACLTKVHSHKKRTSHKAVPLKIPPEFLALQEHCAVPRVYMELFAVVCIATSHYVTFAKCGPGPDAPWCFFDSMADRRGEQDGYNIPEVVPCPDLPQWLSEDWDRNTLLSDKSDESVPQYVKRLFSDAYMCLYQSPDLLSYR